MKKTKLVLLMLAASLMMFGCGKKEVQEDTPVETTQEPKEEEAKEEVEEPVKEEEPAIVAPDGKVRSTLTGEWIDESLEKKRPIALMFNNIQVACPQTGIAKADIIYECNVEGNLTRLMGIFKDWENIEKIGSVRSCRDYFVYWALEWDSIYCHFGGPSVYVDDILGRSYVDNLDGTKLDGTVYFRSSDRVAPHNAYASGAGILKGIEKYNFSRDYTSNYEGEHYKFVTPGEKVELKDGVSATHVEPGYTVNKPYFDYNESDGLYYRFQYGGKHIDNADNSQLAYTNIILQNTYYETRDAKGYLAYAACDEGTGWYITGGKAIEVTWVKNSDFAPTRYYDKSGNEITINNGKTWVCIVQDQNKDKVVIQ